MTLTNLNKPLQTILTQVNKSNSPHAKLIAVSKFFPSNNIVALYNDGLRDFAESYPQEFEQKIHELSHLKDIVWHFIGNIQSNKTKIIATHADYLHSLTKQSHAKRLNEQRPLIKPPLQVMIEVNISNEDNKHGLKSLEEILALADFIKQLPKLNLIGLMGMASHTKDSSLINQQFNRINELSASLRRNGYNSSELSIGTSNDYLLALNHSSTMLRIGSKIFGERNYDK